MLLLATLLDHCRVIAFNEVATSGNNDQTQSGVATTVKEINRQSGRGIVSGR